MVLVYLLYFRAPFKKTLNEPSSSLLTHGNTLEHTNMLM